MLSSLNCIDIYASEIAKLEDAKSETRQREKDVEYFAGQVARGESLLQVERDRLKELHDEWSALCGKAEAYQLSIDGMSERHRKVQMRVNSLKEQIKQLKEERSLAKLDLTTHLNGLNACLRVRRETYAMTTLNSDIDVLKAEIKQREKQVEMGKSDIYLLEEELAQKGISADTSDSSPSPPLQSSTPADDEPVTHTLSQEEPVELPEEPSPAEATLLTIIAELASEQTALSQFYKEQLPVIEEWKASLGSMKTWVKNLQREKMVLAAQLTQRGINTDA